MPPPAPPSVRSSRRRPASGKEIPCVLAIGGLDPGGGAGILADARAISYAGAFACAAATLLTIQSTSGMRAAQAVSSALVSRQCKEVLAHQRVRAFKLGALGSAENTRAVARILAAHPDVPAVVDTVMRPTRGEARLLENSALYTLVERILPRAALVTANVVEAETLTGRRILDLDDAREAARALVDLGCRAVLLKGGHLRGADAVDLLALAATPTRRASARPSTLRILEISSRRLRVAPFHGGGCLLASLIAGRLASGTVADTALTAAVRWAKAHHHRALTHLADVGGAARVLRF